ncbi:hypothetical protein VTN77DRAFT_3644 [Rasamsonia byssochlamydoides]|uniref:uncharacterized protein n=1 Tax=Rasamsonia byssochlamydoides TaxID=89139 RepID=UPI0037421B4E
MATEEIILKVAEQAKVLASHSWEYGTLAEALLELHGPEMSVFGRSPFSGTCCGDDIAALAYGRRYIRTASDTLVDGEGSSGDPASLGVTALLLGQQDKSYLDAADRQANVLLHQTPRFSNGAISHRETVAELWSDSIYMVPPFLAYYGKVTNKPEIVKEAIHQCKLYHDILADKTTGLWRHVVGPENEDHGFWSTGIGWAAAGMTRVLATLAQDEQSSKEQQQELTRYIKELIDGVIHAGRGEKHLIRNYVTEPSSFDENAGTAALASAVFRLAVLCPDVFGADADVRYIQWALESREAVLRHVDPDTGIVFPVVNPMDSKDPRPARASAEAQCFVILMYAAHRGWEAHSRRGRV